MSRLYRINEARPVVNRVRPGRSNAENAIRNDVNIIRVPSTIAARFRLRFLVKLLDSDGELSESRHLILVG